MYVKNILDETTWKMQFSPIAKKVGLKKLAVNVTLMCVKYLGLKNCEYMKKELE